MYGFNSPRRINAVCDKHGQQLTLVGSGLLTLQPQCVIKDESITIQGYQSVTSNSYDSYTSLINLENVSRPNPFDPLTHTMDTYRTHLDNLTDLQNLLAQQTALDFPTQIENINIHYTIVGYTALTLAIILIVYNIWSRNSTKKPRETPSGHPIPQQRTTTPKFNVTET